MSWVSCLLSSLCWRFIKGAIVRCCRGFTQSRLENASRMLSQVSRLRPQLRLCGRPDFVGLYVPFTVVDFARSAHVGPAAGRTWSSGARPICRMRKTSWQGPCKFARPRRPSPSCTSIQAGRIEPVDQHLEDKPDAPTAFAHTATVGSDFADGGDSRLSRVGISPMSTHSPAGKTVGPWAVEV